MLRLQWSGHSAMSLFLCDCDGGWLPI